jgi:hypothetical protein
MLQNNYPRLLRASAHLHVSIQCMTLHLDDGIKSKRMHKVLACLSAAARQWQICTSAGTTTWRNHLSKRMQSMCVFACEHPVHGTAFMMRQDEAVLMHDLLTRSSTGCRAM